ncbi:MAG: outer membrane lipid asymmetry maintenance protein MlaD [Verrucomicrobiota bacterium]
MNNKKIEFFVGCFVLVGLIAVLYLAIQIGGARFFGNDSYQVKARFGNASGVNPGSRVQIAGVPVGTVAAVDLSDDFYAILTLQLPNSLELDDDTIASVRTAGLIGDRFVQLAPGGSGIPLEPGDTIIDTESAMNIEELIRRFALGGIDGEEE